MSNLITIQTTDNLEQIVSCIELHEKLGLEQRFNDWIIYQIKRLNLEDGKDFYTILSKSQGGRPATDYLIPIDIAKHICMMSGGKKAYEIRRYFIEVEKRWNSPDALMARAIKMADIKIIQLKNIVGELKPKADSFDDLMNSNGNFSMNEAAKTLNYEGVGPKTIFKVLRSLDVFYKRGSIWLPKQEHIISKRFVVKQHPVKKGSVIDQYTQVFVTPKGLDWLNKTLADNGYKKLSNDPVLV